MLKPSRSVISSIKTSGFSTFSNMPHPAVQMSLCGMCTGRTEYKGDQCGRFFPIQWIRHIIAGLQSALDRSISVSGKLDGHLFSGFLQSCWIRGCRKVVSSLCEQSPGPADAHLHLRTTDKTERAWDFCHIS